MNITPVGIQLFENEIDDKPGEGLLHYACCRGSVEFIRSLINKGADINEQNDRGNTPLHNACICGKIETINLLLDSGADCTILNRRGKSPFDCLPENRQQELIEKFTTKNEK